MDTTALLRKEIITTNSIGQEEKTYQTREVFCKARSVTRREFYEAAQAGMRPEVVLTLSHRLDYEGEKEAEWQGRVYLIRRTYWTEDSDAIELILEERTALNGLQ